MCQPLWYKFFLRHDENDGLEVILCYEKNTKWNRLAEQLRKENVEKFSMDKMTELLLQMVDKYADKIPQPMQIKLPKLATV